MSFMENLKETIGEGQWNESMTENGGLGFRTTGKELLDMNFAVATLRKASESEIVTRFSKVFYENKMLAVKWLFFVGDVRGGLGERRLFRICMKYLAESHKDIAKELLPLVAFYTRWDNLWVLLDTDLKYDIITIVKKQLEMDMSNMKKNESMSLLAKWMPSANTSSNETKRYAHILMEGIGIGEREYRKMLSALRKHLNIVETAMSSKEWSSIDYSTVPSRANLMYNKAFLRNDEERRREFLESLKKGETKINAGVLFPQDIVHKYTNGGSNICGTEDIAIEEMWKALPDYVKGAGNTICVADGSGSMTSRIDNNSSVSALDAANALAIYFAERSTGEFKDTYITFSENPQIVDLSHGKSLKEKLEIAFRHNEVANTNVEKVFDLILDTAINKKLHQEELPNNILILSDMEFDGCVGAGQQIPSRNWFGQVCYTSRKATKKDFEIIKKKYEAAGYKLPRLVFWNLNSRTGTIPIKENDMGVALVSGFSPVIVNMVLSNKLDPFEILVDQINSERYDAVENAVKDLLSK